MIPVSELALSVSIFYLGKGEYLQTPLSIQFGYKSFLGSTFPLVEPSTQRAGSAKG